MKKEEEVSQIPTKKLSLQIPALVVSIIIAVFLAKTGAIPELLTNATGTGYIFASFIAGFFFSSFFGVAPATIAFIEIAPTAPSLLLVAIAGGLGAMAGDLSIFQILKFGILDDLTAYFQRRSQGAFKKVFNLPIFKYLLFILGGIFVATPVPDEIGLAMMGLANMSWRYVAPVGFVLNGAGILVLCEIARAVAT
ncbi:MAG: hypothetical protein COU10_04230 [Candidatus Harrisonbacteria bacterium CG10_big_fil_rev_8_21_14_0_10_45_28]|uniref:TVP38/TMEM64 family membrane protein n=1 Tax=Candidatus Harrisonbacteria bacterium CG10_big_fil_rev_8_21_14_0_10_45_28 TaxID=1974586 RepID=A0A2H0UM83_9BACT|nr:MAG: hypothetical protein COU10_04230 [Candidatus Harrisonbacteria bacterium CG10_big_fil_rev_8_21_14_0_10_45_28]